MTSQQDDARAIRKLSAQTCAYKHSHVCMYFLLLLCDRHAFHSTSHLPAHKRWNLQGLPCCLCMSRQCSPQRFQSHHRDAISMQPLTRHGRGCDFCASLRWKRLAGEAAGGSATAEAAADAGEPAGTAEAAAVAEEPAGESTTTAESAAVTAAVGEPASDAEFSSIVSSSPVSIPSAAAFCRVSHCSRSSLFLARATAAFSFLAAIACALRCCICFSRSRRNTRICLPPLPLPQPLPLPRPPLAASMPVPLPLPQPRWAASCRSGRPPPWLSSAASAAALAVLLLGSGVCRL